MAVNFTPNIGLAKPTDDEVAKNWTHVQKLAEDNNLIIEDETDINSVSYTPVLTALTTPPSFGAGFIEGEYQEVQGFIMGSFRIIFLDPGITVGSGDYAVSLPFPADATYHTVGNTINGFVGTATCIGEGFVRDSSSVNNCGSIALDVTTVAGVSYVRLVTEVHPGKTSRLFTNNMPFAVANDDSIAGSFFYKKA